MNRKKKNNIEKMINSENIKDAELILNNKKIINSWDRDAWFYKCVIFLIKGDLSNAQKIADKCVVKFPTSYEAYYYRGSVYQAKNMIIEALEAYMIARALQEYNEINDDSMKQDINEQIDFLENRLKENIEVYAESQNIDEINKIDSFIERRRNIWGKFESAPRNSEDLIVGRECWVTKNDRRYIGIYRSPIPQMIGSENMSLVRTQAEFLNFSSKGNFYKIDGATKEYLLPIASEQGGNKHLFKEKNKEYIVVQNNSKHFNYYRVKNGTDIYSEQISYYGVPIPLGHNENRRKLVLSFFVDGLAQSVIEGGDFEKLMPNTYHFFSKGTICNRVYSCSEWTYPSLATYESGLSTLNHMMFHNEIDGELPENVPTLSEYFKKKGYYTSKIDGEWRSIYSYGYARGVDQYVYQIQPMGGRAEQEIVNVIEHLESFKETDQYLWMTVGDLHDIADGLDLSIAVQHNLTLEEREFEVQGKTSVKQNYSSKKSEMYKKTIYYFDILFGILYSYIENNYSDEEILISLFSDHGQGYLVPNNKPFLSKERSNVAFMFRGKGVEQKISDELISTADYLPIMCELAGLQRDDISIDGRLPVTFGGEQEREYTVTESLHPGDNYCAVINTKDYEIYFENIQPTDGEGRFTLGPYKIYGFDSEGVEIFDKELLSKYENIFLDRIAERIIYE